MNQDCLEGKLLGIIKTNFRTALIRIKKNCNVNSGHYFTPGSSCPAPMTFLDVSADFAIISAASS